MNKSVLDSNLADIKCQYCHIRDRNVSTKNKVTINLVDKYYCNNCNQQVDTTDKYCKQCGNILI